MDLAGGRHGEGIQELDLVRHFIGGEPATHVALQRLDERRRRRELWGEHHKGLDAVRALGVRFADDCCIGHRWMGQQTVFDLGRANPISRTLEHIVGAALVPEVACLIHRCQIARAAPVANELIACGGLVLPVAQKENGICLGFAARAIPVAVNGNLAAHAGRAAVTVFVDHGHIVTWIRTAHAARARGPAVGVADDVVDLGLPKHLIDTHAQGILAVSKDRLTD